MSVEKNWCGVLTHTCFLHAHVFFKHSFRRSWLRNEFFFVEIRVGTVGTCIDNRVLYKLRSGETKHCKPKDQVQTLLHYFCRRQEIQRDTVILNIIGCNMFFIRNETSRLK